MSSTDASSSNDLLRNARFASTSSGIDEIQAPDASQLFSSAGSSGAAALHPLAGLNNGELDYLLLDDAKLHDLEGGQSVLPSRGWGDELCYGTGTTYLFGLTAGGLWGLREGLARSRKIPMASASASNIASSTLKQAGEAAAASTSAAMNSAAKTVTQAAAAGASAVNAATSTSSSTTPTSTNAPNPTAAASPSSRAASALKSTSFRVRLNTVLNSISRRGTFVGNNAGVLALIYNGFNSSLDKYRGKHDIYGSMLAGASTGLLWKSTAGVRPMFIASAGLTAGAAAWTTIKPKLV